MSNYIGPENIIQKKKAFLFPCTQHFYKNPPQIVKGEMQYLFDSDGNKYLDFFAGVSVVNCGHCNPEILNTTIEQLKTLQHTSTIYLTEPIVNLAQKLSHVLPGDINHSFFCCTGSEANEGALLLARIYTGRNGFISLSNSLHGRTYLTMSVTGLPMWRADPKLSDCVTFVPNAYNKDKTLEVAANESLEAVQRVIDTKGSEIAALIAEPLQGNGGIIAPPLWYFKKLKAMLEKSGILLIIDEVQTGFARTGKMFAIEHYDVIPDIITVAKALGNGVPISAFCTNDKIASKFTNASASTLGGNPVAASTALAVLDYIDKNNLNMNAKNLGIKLKAGLLKLKDKYPIIYDVRGMGLMIGIELIKENGEPATQEADSILDILKDEGVLLGKNGPDRNVLAFQPPLVITENDVAFVLHKLDLALGKLDL